MVNIYKITFCGKFRVFVVYLFKEKETGTPSEKPVVLYLECQTRLGNAPNSYWMLTMAGILIQADVYYISYALPPSA